MNVKSGLIFESNRIVLDQIKDFCTVFVTLDQKWKTMRLKKNIALSESGFVFDPSTGDSYSLNEQAQEIVKLMNENKSLDEISDHITTIFEIDKPGFEKYYYDFIGMLRQNQLLEEDE